MEHCESDITNEEVSGNVYRYKFSESFVILLSNFSKVHQFDDRKDFKESFSTWRQENKELIMDEETRLTELGYTGDIVDKMFRSARYYFRTKTTKKPVGSRKRYTQLSPLFLEMMNRHLEINKQLKPAISYDLFCIEYHREIEDESRLIETTGECAQLKIKKAFKNKYFHIKNAK
jgi:hypothetical protein